MIYPENVTGFICGSIACDGCIGKITTKTPAPNIEIITTTDLKRAEEVNEILSQHGIKSSVCKSGRSNFNKVQKYNLRLWRINDQWASLLESIEYWNMSNWIGQRKYGLLKKLV